MTEGHDVSQIFLITGVSSGLGRGFAQGAIDAGHTVFGTVRKQDDANAFEAMAPGRAHAVMLDLTDPDGPAEAVEHVERTSGPIDVLVNNAGVGVEGPFEETPIDTFRRQFEVNVFGTIQMTKAVLPSMRARRAGTVVFVTSVSGFVPLVGLSAYTGSKHALEGLADTLRLEVAPLGIHVMNVEPGGFRTDWGQRSLIRVERSISDYDDIFEPIRRFRLENPGTQIGDPARAGTALLAALSADPPPKHLLLGSDALHYAREARHAVDAEFDQWAHITTSTDHPAKTQ